MKPNVRKNTILGEFGLNIRPRLSPKVGQG